MMGQVAELCECCKIEGVCLKATFTGANGSVITTVSLCDACALDTRFEGYVKERKVADKTYWLFPF
jgi:hypothetical protein